MNTRLQVEHPITEETLGLDLVRAQIEIAAGAPLPAAWRGGKLVQQGHAIELRLYAEDAYEFLPRTGTMHLWEPPTGPGVRVDAGVGVGSRVGLEYDPLLAKLVVSAPDRDAAIARARRALEEWVVVGVETNAPLLFDVLDAPDFRSGRYATDLIGSLDRSPASPPDAIWRLAGRLLGSPATPRESGGGSSRRFDPWEPSRAAGWRIGS